MPNKKASSGRPLELSGSLNRCCQQRIFAELANDILDLGYRVLLQETWGLDFTSPAVDSEGVADRVSVETDKCNKCWWSECFHWTIHGCQENSEMVFQAGHEYSFTLLPNKQRLSVLLPKHACACTNTQMLRFLNKYQARNPSSTLTHAATPACSSEWHGENGFSSFTFSS
jgi:hypothetical protein